MDIVDNLCFIHNFDLKTTCRLEIKFKIVDKTKDLFTDSRTQRSNYHR